MITGPIITNRLINCVWADTWMQLPFSLFTSSMQQSEIIYLLKIVPNSSKIKFKKYEIKFLDFLNVHLIINYEKHHHFPLGCADKNDLRPESIAAIDQVINQFRLSNFFIIIIMSCLFSIDQKSAFSCINNRWVNNKLFLLFSLIILKRMNGGN